MIKTQLSNLLAGSRIKYAGEIQLKSPYALRRSARNARTHPKKQIAQIAKSIGRFGFTTPILVDSDCVILAGHGRVLAFLAVSLHRGLSHGDARRTIVRVFEARGGTETKAAKAQRVPSRSAPGAV
jgi:ParB-like chromosome segregation protein Spo0J